MDFSLFRTGQRPDILFLLFKILMFCTLLATLTSCGSIAKGITEAVLENESDKEDRICHVRGREFSGMQKYLDKQTPENPNKATLKILMIHGMGEHFPGYSARLQRNLMQSLSLDVSQERYKDISLWGATLENQKLGNLRINRYFDKNFNKEAYFYELTWSEIISEDKKLLRFDATGDHTLYRSKLNNQMKQFFNDHIPDPLFYVGNKRKAIQTSVIESMCWIYKENWDELSQNISENCDPTSLKLKTIQNTDLSIITHSLGSQISIDALQLIVGRLARLSGAEDNQNTFLQTWQKSRFSIFMMANQLPLLQLAVEPPEVSNKKSEYCSPDGAHYADRIFDEVSIFAFSDPNDVLSYAIEPRFADNRIDSRLCPTVTNINVNVTNRFRIPGLGEIANPIEAHSGYDADKRVIDLIAHGIGTKDETSLVSEQCVWDQVVAHNHEETHISAKNLLGALQ